MAPDNLFPLIFRLVTSLPTRQEQLLILAEAWLLVAREDLQAALRNEKFKEAQTDQLTQLDRMRDFISEDAELELQQQPQMERAIEEADWGELEQLEKKVKRRPCWGMKDTLPFKPSSTPGTPRCRHGRIPRFRCPQIPERSPWVTNTR